MTIEITETDKAIRVVYKNDRGGQASAVIIGNSVSEIKDRSEDIIQTHSLRERAEDET